MVKKTSTPIIRRQNVIYVLFRKAEHTHSAYSYMECLRDLQDGPYVVG